MTSDSTTKVAAITGGGSGIGRETALALARGGHRVLVTDMNDAAAAGTIALAAAEGLEHQMVPAHVDVRSEADVAAACARAVGELGRLDVWINNAGVGGAFGPVTAVEADDWDFTFDVMARGVFFGIKHAARTMEDGGAIVNIASAAAFSGGFAAMAYAAAKAAVLSMTRSAAVELAPRYIRVNAVCPGVIRTPLLEAGRAEELDTMLPLSQPLPRWDALRTSQAPWCS